MHDAVWRLLAHFRPRFDELPCGFALATQTCWGPRPMQRKSVEQRIRSASLALGSVLFIGLAACATSLDGTSDVRLFAQGPIANATMPVWDDAEVGVEHLPLRVQPAARKDKRAIGDVVNVLRLARCAYTIDGSAKNTFEEALETIRSRSALARRYGCEWAPSYFGRPQNAPVVSYERLGVAKVRVCANFERSWTNVLALDYYAGALENWPTSLPELQGSVASGHTCYSVSLSRNGDG